MIQAWVLMPVLFGLASLGWGLGVERIAGRRMPGELLLPVGLAAMVVVTRILVVDTTLAKLGAPVVVLVAIAGALARRGDRRRPGVDRWMAAAAVGVFLVFAAPVVLSGHATFAGYTVLGDTSFQFTLVDSLTGDGPGGSRPSAYTRTVEVLQGLGLPAGHARRALGP